MKKDALTALAAWKLSLMGNSTVATDPSAPSTSSSTIPLKRVASSDNEKENPKNQRQHEKIIAEPPQEPQQEGGKYLFPLEDTKENDAPKNEVEFEPNLPIGGGMQDAEKDDDAIIDQQQEYRYDVENAEHQPEHDVRVFTDKDDGDKVKLECTFCHRINTRKRGIGLLRKDCMNGLQVRNGIKPIPHFPVMKQEDIKRKVQQRSNSQPKIDFEIH